MPGPAHPLSSIQRAKLAEDSPSTESIELYTSVKSRCLYDYHPEQDRGQAFVDSSKLLRENRTLHVGARAVRGDQEAILELAIRHLTGCAVSQRSLNGAMCRLEALVDPSSKYASFTPYLTNPVPALLRAQAHACAALVFLEINEAIPQERAKIEADEGHFAFAPIPQNGAGKSAFIHFSLAVHHANESAKLGLISPVVLQIGFALRDVGSSLGVDLSQMPRFRLYRPLWRAVTRRLEGVCAEERERLRKAGNKSNECVCAAEGCGISVQALSKTSLRVCAGSCPPDLKPRYCSEECETKDWPRHKAICRPMSIGEIPVIGDKTQALALFELGDPALDGSGNMGNVSNLPVAPSSASCGSALRLSLAPLPPGEIRTTAQPPPFDARALAAIKAEVNRLKGTEDPKKRPCSRDA